MKNEGSALPLPGLGDVVVIGEMARTPRYQGARSSQVSPTHLDNALDALRRRYPNLPFEPGYPLPGSPAATFTTEELLRRAQERRSCCSSACPPRTSQRDTTANTSYYLLTIWACCMQCAGSPTR